jgi:hypothetical protein
VSINSPKQASEQPPNRQPTTRTQIKQAGQQDRANISKQNLGKRVLAPKSAAEESAKRTPEEIFVLKTELLISMSLIADFQTTNLYATL